MKILLVTGKLAEPLIQRIIDEMQSLHTFDLLVLPVAVAAFLHPKYVSSQIKLRGPLKKYDLILLPGMVSGDTALVTESTGIPTFKGTRHAADLPFLLEKLFDVKLQLSTTQSADLVLTEQLRKKAERDLAKAESPAKKPIPKGTLKIGKGSKSLLIGSWLPMRIMAEITDTPLKSEEEIIREAKYFIASGAHIIDIGMVAGSPDPDVAKAIAQAIRKQVSVPVSIDSSNAQEIIAGLEGGADLVLSLDQDNMMDVPKKYRGKATFVVIPATQEGAKIPKSRNARVQLLMDNLSNARSLGFKHLIADPLCDPLITPGLSQALQAYFAFHAQQPEIPLLMGIGNVTELLDADSPGVNALLAGIATELGVSLLLTTEVSPKTRGAVREVYRATQMMYLARRRRSHAKDLGIDLLLFKSKNHLELPLEPIREAVFPIQDVTRELLPHRLDSTGYFTFHVDRGQRMLVARHYKADSTETPNIELRGYSAQQIIDGILTRRLVSQLDHAAYIGRELAKAEIALATGRPYVQEAALFKAKNTMTKP